MKPSLILLAAGMGSRYGGLKQMDAFGPHGETIMDYSVYDAIEAGFGKIIFVIRDSFREDFENFFKGKFEDKVEVHYVSQELTDLPEGFTLPEGREKPWGTSHAVWVCRHVVKEPFAVVNADDFYGRQAFKILHDYLSDLDEDSSIEYTTVSYYLKNTLSDYGTVNRGVCQVGDDGNLVSVKECTKIGRQENGTISYPDGDKEIALSEDDQVSMNMWGFIPDFFDHTTRLFSAFLSKRIDEPKSEYYIPETIQTLMDEGNAVVKVMSSNEKWFGVTYQDDKPFVSKSIDDLVANGTYPAKLWS